MSHPTRVCGLKPFTNIIYPSLQASHPTRVCGLKLMVRCLVLAGLTVTPYTGVWIETCMGDSKSLRFTVTPYTGVWIETLK